MTKLLVRPWEEAERETLINDWGVRPEAFRSKDTYICVCEERGKLLGYAIGRDKTGDRLCTLDSCKAPNRKDAWLAMLAWHARNGLRLKNVWAEALIPEEGQCTEIAPTRELLPYMRERLALESAAVKRNVRTGALTYRVNPRLVNVLAALEVELKQERVEVEYH